MRGRFLVGERAHYELAAGRVDAARRLLHVLESFADDSGLIPEQVWDSQDLPAKSLLNGRPSSSARPLVWAHAEHVKLLRSLRDGRVFDTPPQTTERYLVRKTASRYVPWRFTSQPRIITAGQILRLETATPARVRWTDDDWKTAHDSDSEDTGLGLHYTDLTTNESRPGTRTGFTFYWPQANRWEGRNFEIAVTDGR